MVRTQQFSPIAEVVEGQTLPFPTETAVYDDQDALLIATLAGALEREKQIGNLPDLSEDLTEIRLD